MKVLAIGAHPDDIEIGCGGTLAQYIADGAEVEFIIATNGEQGSHDLAPKDLAKIRREEAENSAKTLGAGHVHFLGLPDGLTSFSTKDKVALIELIRRIKPKIVLTHAKQDHFTDHRVIHELTMAAIFSAAGPWFQDAKGKPHTVQEVYGYEVWHPLNRWQKVVEIDNFFDKKLQALQEHRSQIKDMNYIDAVRGLALYRGALSANSIYAEAFEVLKI